MIARSFIVATGSLPIGDVSRTSKSAARTLLMVRN
jgi:hypothetical protein